MRYSKDVQATRFVKRKENWKEDEDEDDDDDGGREQCEFKFLTHDVWNREVQIKKGEIHNINRLDLIWFDVASVFFSISLHSHAIQRTESYMQMFESIHKTVSSGVSLHLLNGRTWIAFESTEANRIADEKDGGGQQRKIDHSKWVLWKKWTVRDEMKNKKNGCALAHKHTIKSNPHETNMLKIDRIASFKTKQQTLFEFSAMNQAHYWITCIEEEAFWWWIS